MNAIMKATNTTAIAVSTVGPQARTYLTTTLYDLISAIQSLVESNDDLVVTMMQHLLDSGYVTWNAKPTAGIA